MLSLTLLFLEAWGLAAQVTPESLQPLLQEHKQTILHLYKDEAPLTEIFDKVAEDGKKYQLETLLAKMNLKEHPEMEEFYKVQNLPALLWFERDEALHFYDGPHLPVNVIRYVNDMAFFSLSYFGNRKDMLDNRWAEGVKDRTVIAYEGGLKKGNPELSMFEGLGSIMRMEGKFVAYPHPLGKIDMPNIEVFRVDGTSTKTPFTQQVDIIDLMRFIKGERVPYVLRADESLKWMADNSPHDTLYVVSAQLEETAEQYEQAGMSIRGKLTLATITPEYASEFYGPAKNGEFILDHKQHNGKIFQRIEKLPEENEVEFVKRFIDYEWETELEDEL